LLFTHEGRQVCLFKKRVYRSVYLQYNCATLSKIPSLPATTHESAAGSASGQENSEARERVLAAAYELFSHQGIRGVGVDSIIASAGVAKMTLYRHFPAKEHLVLAFLQRREQLWTLGWLQAEVTNGAATPGQQLLTIFDVFDEWFRRDDFEGCSFINVLLETVEPGNPVRQASAAHLARIREFLQRLAEEAGVSQPDDFARKWHILMKGSIVAAGEGDQLAARRARAIGVTLLRAEGVKISPSAERRVSRHHRPVTLSSNAVPSKKK
jgi:AcrR family transcriptional regulator